MRRPALIVVGAVIVSKRRPIAVGDDQGSTKTKAYGFKDL